MEKERRQKLFPVEIKENNSRISERVVDTLIYKNHYVIIKKTHTVSSIQVLGFQVDGVSVLIQFKMF